MDGIRFLLDGEVIEVDGVEPTRTVLQFLRENLRRVGTKEGCAEGDCGACTVVVAELQDERLRYRAVNACIQFLPTLDGKALFTVESLKGADGSLHPVQQSLVDNHGSQCGFCTPGFVMSMFALYQNGRTPGRAQIDDALSGNLCRCTGYRPIVDACLKMHEYPATMTLDERDLIARLRALGRDSGFQYQNPGAHYQSPVNIDELAEACLADPDACILAGGTDVGLWVTKQLRELPRMIYLGNVGELKNIASSDTDIDIGAAVTLEEAFAVLAEEYQDFAEMFRRFASVPVRNAGTLAGNVANGSPIGDSMPALIAAGAQVCLRRGGERRMLAMEDLYLDYMKNAMRPGEFIESIRVPRAAADTRYRCYKLCKRYDQDISAVARPSRCASTVTRSPISVSRWAVWPRYRNAPPGPRATCAASPGTNLP